MHGLAPACPFRLRRRRISLHDSINIAIFGEKSKCEDFWRCGRIFLYLFIWTEGGGIIIYQTADGETRLDVRIENDSVWLTQAQIAQLFGTEIPAISKHIRNIFQSGEPERAATVSKMEMVRQEGKRTVKRRIDTYNLDMILSVGYRVNSKNATQFRIWANQVLKEYLIKGYAVNSQAKIEQLEELKQTVRLLSNVLSAKEVTKSEAFDMTRDSRQALEAVIRTGCRRVLTSGGRNTAQEGIETLRALAAQAAGRIEVMAGSGVGPSNARLLAATGVDALHFSARRERESGMRFRNPQVSMGGCAGVPEYTLTDADETLVRQLLAKLE